MPGTELVTYDRVPWVSNGVSYTDMIRVFLVAHQADGLDTSCLGVLKRGVLWLV